MSGMNPYYADDYVTLYHGDCRELLPYIEADALITDPPYGMGWDGRVTRGKNGTGKAGPTRHYGLRIAQDDEPFDPSPFLGYRGVVMWGFHHFASRLPKGSVLVWLKRHDTGFGSFLSDADLAWMKGGEGVYCRRDLTLQGEERAHPTQKPVGIMKWCIESTGIDGTILDPFAGSGSTLVAAKSLNRRAIGIEIEERYCEIAANRLRQEVLGLSA
jgi:hypothetical protein